MDQEVIKTIQNVIHGLLHAMGLEATVQPEDTITKGLVFNIVLPRDFYALIGHRGAHLHALEVVVQAIVGKRMRGSGVPYFSLDVDDYRRKREWYIKETVKGAVQQVKRTGRAAALVPMPNYERKLVHALLQAHFPEAVSTSSGAEPYRRVVIRMKQ